MWAQLLLGDAGPAVGHLDPGRLADSAPTRTSTHPRSVNLIALSTRLPISCRSRCGSPKTIGVRVVLEASARSAFRRRAVRRSASTSLAICASETRLLGNLVAAIGLGQRQHAVDHRGQRRRSRAAIVSRLSWRIVGSSIAPAQQHLRVGVDRRERRLELVRRVGDELPLARERLCETREQIVEARRPAGRSRRGAASSRRCGSVETQPARAGRSRSRASRATAR